MPRSDWFEWERESAIHTLYPYLEAGSRSLMNYIRLSWPDSILIYKGNVVLWCLHKKAFREFGSKLVDYYLADEQLKTLKQDVNRSVARLKSLFAKIEKTDPASLGNDELANLHAELIRDYVEWFKISNFIEPLALDGEARLRQKVGEKNLPVITFVTRKSFSKREEEEMLAIMEKKDAVAARKALEAHASKYFWKNNNYLKTTRLGADHFEKELGQMRRDVRDPQKYLDDQRCSYEEMLRKKQELVQGLSDSDRCLVELLDFMGWFQDYRKEYTLQVLHHLDLLLSEIGRRSGFSLAEMKFAFPSEVGLALSGKLSREDVLARMRNCLIIWRKDAPACEIYSGEEARRLEESVFERLTHAREIVEIDGTVANRGKVRGRAFVTMSAEEARNLRQGEILVTSMTSPDFVPALKRAAAIVTNEGGILCHAAIVSREFGIPCITGTRIATEVIKTGDLLEVDGDHGKVRKLV